MASLHKKEKGFEESLSWEADAKKWCVVDFGNKSRVHLCVMQLSLPTTLQPFRAAQITLLSIIFNGVSSQPLVHCAHSKIGFTLSDKETYIVLNPKVRT